MVAIIKELSLHHFFAGVVKLADTLDLGSSAARLVGSSPSTRTLLAKSNELQDFCKFLAKKRDGVGTLSVCQRRLKCRHEQFKNFIPAQFYETKARSYVGYYVLNPTTNKMVRKRIKVKQLKTRKAR